MTEQCHNPAASLALKAYADSLNRTVRTAIAAHAPGRTVAPAAVHATRTIAVGVIANIVAELIARAPDGTDKGSRKRLHDMAVDIIEGRI